MAKQLEVVAKLDGVTREKDYLYYLKVVEGVLCLCRSKRRGK